MPVTGQQLRDLTGSTRLDGELSLFLQQAQLVVDEELPLTAFSSSRLNSIALYLAGHFYVLSVESGGITYARAGQSEERYKSFGYDTYGFMTTRFGQMACALDVTGTLTAMSEKRLIPFEFESYTNAKAPSKPVDVAEGGP
jgi:hypothetical protein